MKINFKSLYKSHQDDQPNIIEFTSRLDRDFEDGFNVLTFEENRNGKIITNRIEYNDKSLRIYSGVSSLNCELNEVVKNDFVVDGMNKSFYLYTKMTDMVIKDDYLNFKYLLSHSQDFDLITSIELDIKISPDEEEN